MPKKLCNKELYFQFANFNTSDKEKFSLESSFNQETTLNEETKLVIVGTITPPNTKYFYCSYYNFIYGYIDEALKLSGTESSLKKLKYGLSKVDNKKIKIELLNPADIKSRVDEIKSILKRNKIAFLDTMDKVIRKRNSHYDKDILYYSVDNAKLEQLKKLKNVTVIANSKLASALCMEAGVNFTYLAQRGGRKEEWLNMISETLTKR